MSTVISGDGSITRTGGVDTQGTDTNDSAAVGEIGEYVESVVLQASAVALVTATAKTVTSISLTAGDWDAFGMIGVIPAATTTFTLVAGGVSTTTDSLDIPKSTAHRCASFAPGAVPWQYAIPTVRLSLSATTTVYLVSTCVFATSTAASYGRISARRVR